MYGYVCIYMDMYVFVCVCVCVSVCVCVVCVCGCMNRNMLFAHLITTWAVAREDAR